MFRTADAELFTAPKLEWSASKSGRSIPGRDPANLSLRLCGTSFALQSAMLTARFESPLGDKFTAVGPEPFFMSEGEALKTSSGEPIAVHRAGLWQRGKDAYISISFETPITLAFEDQTTGGKADFGPFPKLRMVNGSIWIKKDQDVQLLAHFSDINWVWTIFPIPTLKASKLIIKPA